MQKNLRDLMVAYSRRGLDDWNSDAKPSSDLRAKASACLMNSIVENESEIDDAVDGSRNGRRFIPMPGQKRRGFDWCFFLPSSHNGELKSLVLFVLVNRANRHGIAFRFECAVAGRHDYSHVQLTVGWSTQGGAPTTADGAQGLCVPVWLPVRYPAFPIRAEDWTEMFLVMMVAVHGHDRGIDLIKEIFQNAQPVDYARKYQDKLGQVLARVS